MGHDERPRLRACWDDRHRRDNARTAAGQSVGSLDRSRLRLIGLTADEAGNLAAYLNGLRIIGQGWTPIEIERLLFVRALAARSRIA